MLVRVCWRAEVIVSTTQEQITGVFRTYQRLAAQCVEHLWRSPAYCPTGYVCLTEHRNRQDTLTKGVEELVHISWWIFGGQWLRNIPGVSLEGDIRIPYAASFVWRGCFQWGIERKNYTVDRHGRSAVVMLSVIKCCFFGGVLIRETSFCFSQKNGFASGWADKKLIESSR